MLLRTVSGDDDTGGVDIAANVKVDVSDDNVRGIRLRWVWAVKAVINGGLGHHLSISLALQILWKLQSCEVPT